MNPTKFLSLEPVKRNAILNSALKEFASKGFDKASTNIIAKEAEISKPLMFHYVTNKKELFLCVYDYFAELLAIEYRMKMNFTEKDIFARLRQSYLLQIELIQLHPWILDFSKLSRETDSEELNKNLEERVNKQEFSCGNQIFDTIDGSKFRKDLDIEMCKRVIFWANVGFTNDLVDAIRATEPKAMNFESIVHKLDEYLDGLRNIFYVSGKE